MLTAEEWKNQFLVICFSQIRIIIATFALVLLGALGIAFYWPATYESSASIMLRSVQLQDSPGTLQRLQTEGDAVQKEDVSTELRILTSNHLIQRTLKKLVDQGAIDVSAYFKKGDENIAAATRAFKKQIDIKVIPSTKVVKITFRANSVQDAEHILAQHLDEYIVYRASVFYPGDQEHFFKSRAAYYRQETEKLENELKALSTTDNIALPLVEIKENHSLAAELYIILSELKDQQANSLLRQQPILEDRIAQIQNQIDAIQARNNLLNGFILSEKQINREIELAEISYKTFAERLEEADINSAIVKAKISADITILSPPQASAQKLFPIKKLVLIVGVLLGTILSFTLGFLNAFFDQTIKTVDDLKTNTTVPFLCSLKEEHRAR